MAERDVMAECLKRGSQLGARLFRQNVGLGWVGRIVKRTADTVTLKDPRPLHAGLMKGSADIIGWLPVVITPDMVGRTVAVFVSVETKAEKGGTLRDEQEHWRHVVHKNGGIAGVVRSVDQLEILLRNQIGR